jgi:hypothetical protein
MIGIRRYEVGRRKPWIEWAHESMVALLRWKCSGLSMLSGPVDDQPNCPRTPPGVGIGAGPVLDDRSSSHPARCRDPAAGERSFEATRLRKRNIRDGFGCGRLVTSRVLARQGGRVKKAPRSSPPENTTGHAPTTHRSGDRRPKLFF